MQGRKISGADIAWIRRLMGDHPQWGRTRLSMELCEEWNWRNALGRPKDMAARTLLLKLERGGWLQLPPRRSRTGSRPERCIPASVVHATDPIVGALRDLRPLSVKVVAPGTQAARLFDGLLSEYHYLGYRTTVGENLRYLISDRNGRSLACLLFGAAAWKCADRDAFIGWERTARERNLQRLTNNTRFLVLPWVRVPHLASHLLGLISRRIRDDWQAKYGHPVEALETFVDRSRFKGTCYRAANWLRVGATRGRTRNDRAHCIRVAIKDVYLLALNPNFKKELCSC